MYLADPEAYKRHLAEGNAHQPRKRTGADVLLRDEAGRILLVDPTYKPDWDLPGGMCEANEAPHDAAVREVREELGITVELGDALCIDWVPPHGPWDDSIMFIFDGGVLAEKVIGELRLVSEEVREFAFVDLDEAKARLRPYYWHRVRTAVTALHAGRTSYVYEGGQQ